MTPKDDWRREPTAYQVRSVVRTIDPSIAHIARVQDYWLGGKDHFEADRIAGDEVIALLPDTVASVRENRAFLGRTVRFLASEAGIRQFLDLGTGMPTASNTHEVAQALAPESKIAYVDNDPMVLAHARALLNSPRPSAAKKRPPGTSRSTAPAQRFWSAASTATSTSTGRVTSPSRTW